jgi:hypothetical protein
VLLQQLYKAFKADGMNRPHRSRFGCSHLFRDGPNSASLIFGGGSGSTLSIAVLYGWRFQRDRALY